MPLNRYDITSTIKRLAFAVIALVFAATASLAQTSAPAPASAPDKIKVVASFSILGDLTRQIAGDRAEITTLVGPNGDAHVYRATPHDAKTLAAAKLIVVNGLGFESFMPRLIKSSGSKAAIVTASTGIAPLVKAAGKDAHGHAHDHGKTDPHAWQSIEAVKIYAGNTRDGLIQADPAGAASYKANAEAYLGKLNALKAELEAGFAAIPPAKRIVITNHDAFGYFAREFGFTLHSVQGVSTEAEPSAKDVARIIRAAREAKARAVFIENMSDPRLAERLASEANAKLGGTLYSDALSDEKGAVPTYIDLMRQNAATLIAALKD